MARRVLLQLVDDVDGSEADETVAFSLDGTGYEIDLSAPNASKLRSLFTAWIEHARGPIKRGRGSTSSGLSASELRAIRDWASQRGHHLSDRGRVPSTVIAAYRREQRR